MILLRMKFDPREQFASNEEDRHKLVNILIEHSFAVHPLQHPGPEGLPRKFLPPGAYSDLYRLFVLRDMPVHNLWLQAPHSIGHCVNRSGLTRLGSVAELSMHSVLGAML